MPCAFASALIERLPSVAARSSTPTRSTFGRRLMPRRIAAGRHRLAYAGRRSATLAERSLEEQRVVLPGPREPPLELLEEAHLVLALPPRDPRRHAEVRRPHAEQ